MLHISAAQIGSLRRSRLLHFLRRLDGHLSREVPRWAAVKPEQRIAMLEGAARHAASEGITEEIYVAQFIVLYMAAGAAFFASTGSQKILGSNMEPRLKLYQLIALAGIDLAAAAPRPEPRGFAEVPGL